MDESILSKPIDKKEYTKVLDRVNILSGEVTEMVESIVQSICRDLDYTVSTIRDILKDTDNPITDAELDQAIMNLSMHLYYVSDNQEKLGTEEDVAKAVYKEIFNRVREKAHGTVADKNVAAELSAQNEAIIYIVKSRAYKRIKEKVSFGMELVSSLKKVISRRCEEMKLSYTGGVR